MGYVQWGGEVGRGRGRIGGGEGKWREWLGWHRSTVQGEGMACYAVCVCACVMLMQRGRREGRKSCHQLRFLHFIGGGCGRHNVLSQPSVACHCVQV